MKIQFVSADHPANKFKQVLQDAISDAQIYTLEREHKSAADLFEKVLEDTRISAPTPSELGDQPVREFADMGFKELVGFFRDIFRREGVADQAACHNAQNLAERVQLVTAFHNPEQVIGDVQDKVMSVVAGFPQEAADILCGKNPGDVLDPYILAATQGLMFGGEFEPTIEATVSHKALMMIEGLMGHLHEDVVGAMRGNIRAPEPRGKDQETLDPFDNPFPGADVVRPPLQEGAAFSFHQIKSKTGSAKGGDGKRLGEQLMRLRSLYGGEIFYHALIGNTLRGHRSKAGVEKAAPGVIVLVGEASFEALTSSKVGPQLLMRLYQSAFSAVAHETGYRVDTMAASIVATFQKRAEEEGESFLGVLLDEATSGPRSEQDNRLFVPSRARRSLRKN